MQAQLGLASLVSSRTELLTLSADKACGRNLYNPILNSDQDWNERIILFSSILSESQAAKEEG